MRALQVFLLLSLLAVCTSVPFLEFFKYRASDRRDVDTKCPKDMGGKNCRCFRRGRSFQMRCRGGYDDDDPLLKTSSEETSINRAANITSEPHSDGAFFNPIRGIMQSILPGFFNPFGPPPPPPQSRQPEPHPFFHFPPALGIIIHHHDNVRPSESKSSTNATTATATANATASSKQITLLKQLQEKLLAEKAKTDVAKKS